MTPTRLGPYDLLAELGRGAMGVVYRAVDRRLERLVAIKVLLGATDPAGLDDFMREARAAARLRHPGIVVVYGAEVIDGRRVVALELVEGGSLQQRLRDGGAMPPREAARVAADLAAAVQAAHEQGIVHRDLKPANVLMEKDGRPRLTDFGLARDARAGVRSATGDVIGTPAYMAPEQARGDVHRVGPWTDVWGLGAVLYECLVGQPPFQGKTAHDVMQRIIVDQAAPPSTIRRRRGLDAVAEDLSTICLTALAKDPARRYASAGALEEDLRRFLDGRPILARPPRPLARLLLSWRRHRRTILIGAAAALVTIALVAVGVDLVSRSGRRRRHEATLSAVGPGEGRLLREKAVFELTRDRDPEATPVLVAALRAVTARMLAATHARLLAVRESIDAEERSRQARLEPLVAALAAAAEAPGDGRLAPAHARAIDEARRRLALREGRGRRPEVILAAEHRVVLGEEALLRASVAAEALGLLGAVEAADALGRYLHVEEDPERVLVAAAALGRLRDMRAARAVLRMGERHRRGGAVLSRAVHALGRELGGALPPLEPVTGLDYLDRGQLRLLLEDVPGARADFDRAAALDPQDPLVWSTRAELHFEEQVWPSAAAELDRALTLDPERASDLSDRAFVLAHIEAEHDRALADAERALELDPFDARAYTARAYVRTARNDVASALADLSRAIELDPADSSPWGARARVRAKQRDFQGAIDDHTRALALNPDNPAGWNNRGLIRQGLGDHEGALADITRALDLKPRDPIIITNRAQVRWDLGDAAGAIADASAALELRPTHGAALCIRGRARLRGGDIEGARADLREALTVAPEDPTSWAMWGLFCLTTDDVQEAWRAFDRQVRLGPQNEGGALSSRGFARMRAGDVQGAIEDCSRAVELSPRDAAAWRNLADAHGAADDAGAALTAIERAVLLAPTSSGNWRERGKYRLLLGDLDGALADTTRAVELGPREAENVGMRGAVHRARGERSQAARDFERMLDLMGPDHRDAPAIRRILAEVRAGQ
ncbi:MAG: tetratricopeptide repeat protein [Planctomycetes bacterium]|nr:tetratricopeptide repeat protein [Planctomycetota bacterium]